MKVVWTKTAELSYFRELNFIAEKWSKREVENFMNLVDEFVKKLESKTLQSKVLSHENLRSFVISKQTTLFFNLKSESMFVAKSQNVCQYWCSTEKSNANIALLMVSRFLRALPIVACSLAL